MVSNEQWKANELVGLKSAWILSDSLATIPTKSRWVLVMLLSVPREKDTEQREAASF